MIKQLFLTLILVFTLCIDCSIPAHAFIGSASHSVSVGSRGASIGFSSGRSSYSSGHYYHSGSRTNIANPTLSYMLVLFIPTVIVGGLIWKRRYRGKRVSIDYSNITYADKQRYISQCQYREVNSRACYSDIELENALSKLTTNAVNAMTAGKQARYGAPDIDKLCHNVIELFLTMQQYWCDRNEEKLAKLCSDNQYKKNLLKQLAVMKKLGVYNHIWDTEIKSCQLIESKFIKRKKFYLLRFVIKGEQFDQYNAYDEIKNASIYTKRPFSCFVDICKANDGTLLINDIIFNIPVDDYLINKARLLSQSTS